MKIESISAFKASIKRDVNGRKIGPGWAPSSIICSFDVICPAFKVFEAKQIRIEGFSFPATCT